MGSEILYVRDKSGDFVVAEGEAVVAAAKTHLGRRIHRGAKLTNPKLVRDFLAVTLGDRDCEYFCILLLDAHHRFLRFVELFRGTIDGASVHPREVVKLVLEAQSAAVVLVHNHPLCLIVRCHPVRRTIASASAHRPESTRAARCDRPLPGKEIANFPKNALAPAHDRRFNRLPNTPSGLVTRAFTAPLWE